MLKILAWMCRLCVQNYQLPRNCHQTELLLPWMCRCAIFINFELKLNPWKWFKNQPKRRPKPKFFYVQWPEKTVHSIRKSSSNWDYLIPLWTQHSEKETMFGHRRVVFGVNCSPFLLWETNEYHLKRCFEKSTGKYVTYNFETLD